MRAGIASVFLRSGGDARTDVSKMPHLGAHVPPFRFMAKSQGLHLMFDMDVLSWGKCLSRDQRAVGGARLRDATWR